MQIVDAQRIRASGTQTPLLRLATASRLPPLALGLLCGLVVFLLMLTPLLVIEQGPGVLRDLVSSALFFGASIGILSGCAAPVFRGAAADLDALRPILPLADDELSLLRAALARLSPAQLGRALVIALCIGLLHSYLLGHHLLAIAPAAAMIFGTLLLWLAMFCTVLTLIFNARLFAALGGIARPDLLRPSRHAAFGAAAIRPALFLIGLLCAYPLLLIGDENALDSAVLIGVVVSVISLFGIVLLPLRGIRRRIREQRAQTLAALDERLDAITGGDIAHASADDLFELDAVLDMRERVAQVPGWPVDFAGVKRILLYIVLPPLTWAAAALVEQYMDSLV